MLTISVALGLIACGFVIINAITMRVITPDDAVSVSSSVAILIPMRNEARNVGGIVSSVLAQEHLPNRTVTVLDDQSSDATRTLLSEYEPAISVLHGSTPPSGWLGKIYACSTLAESVDSDYLVFLDADVRLHPRAIAASIAAMERWGWDFASPYPRELARGFLERLIQPLLQWSWLASVPLRIAERLHQPSMVIANGQFMIITRNAYREIGGHASVKGEVLDDLELARALVRGGFRGGVAEASQIAECRMYQSAGELIDGYTKSLWRAFGGIVGTFVAVALLVLTGVFPIAGALTGAPWGWIAFLLVFLARALSAARTGSNPAIGFLHPVATVALLYLIALSWIRKSRGTLHWRGRTVA
jgi:cellulose synthase/poly-beta-1,6-N-acetylglucosamine synthase-like glycosyltransferase